MAKAAAGERVKAIRHVENKQGLLLPLLGKAGLKREPENPVSTINGSRKTKT